LDPKPVPGYVKVLCLQIRWQVVPTSRELTALSIRAAGVKTQPSISVFL